MPVTQRKSIVWGRLALAAAALVLVAAAGCERTQDSSGAAAPPPADTAASTAADSTPADTGAADQGDKGDAAGQAPGECGFATTAEVQAATGVKIAVADGTYIDAARGECHFYTDPSRNKGGVIHLAVAGDDTGIWEAAHKVFGQGGDLTGVADRAYYDPDTGLLDALKGSTRVSVIVAGDDSFTAKGPGKEEMVKVIQAMLPRIDGSET